jgi:hypothetical protein
MNKTQQELRREYQAEKDSAKRFSDWSRLDKFVDSLIESVPALKEEPMHNWQQYAYDDMGTALPHEPLTIAFDPTDGKRIE